MDTDQLPRRHGDVTGRVIRCFYRVYNELGPGFLESVYENALMIELENQSVRAQQQMPMSVFYDGKLVGDFRADLIVEGCVIVELKAAKAIEPVFEAQILNYLRATRLEVGLLLNFGPKPQVKRLIFDNDRKHPK